MLSFIKRYLKFEMMEKLYPVRADEEVLNNFENSRYTIPILALFCSMFYLGENTPGVTVSCLMYLFYTVAFILALIAKKHIRKIRKYEDIVDIMSFAFPEYYAIKFLCENTSEALDFLLKVSIFLWVMSLLIKVPYIIQVSLDNKLEKHLYKYRHILKIPITAILGVALYVLTKVRYGGMETVGVPVFVLAFHLCFTLLYNFLINRIIFLIIYHTEINYELERQRNLIEEKKNNRRTLKRKKTIPKE